MTPSKRITKQAVLSVFGDESGPNEALSANEVAEVVDCSRRTAYKRLNELTDDGLLKTKKVGEQVRIWWPATDHDAADTAPADERFLSDLSVDHVLELEFTSEEMAQPLLEHGMTDIEVSMDEAVTLKDGTQIQYWTVSNAPTGEHIEIVKTRPGVIDVRLLSTADGEHRLEIHTSRSALLRVFEEFDGGYERAFVRDGALVVIGEFPATVDKDAVVDAVPDAYGMELASQRLLVTPNLMRTMAKENLTERQWTAFQMAYYAGYFDRPRISTGADLAARMDITKQTFNRHLRDAKRQVARSILEADVDGATDFGSAE